MTLIFHKTYLETDNKPTSYVCSKTQARRILMRNEEFYKQDTVLAGKGGRCDLSEHRVLRTNGTIIIGCKTFTKKQVAQVRNWLRTKPTKKRRK